MLHIVLYHKDNCAISIDINLSKNNHIGKLWNYWQNMDIWIVFGQSMAFRPLWWSNIGCPLLLSILFGNITTKFHLDYTILVPDNGHTQQFAKLLAKHGYSCRFFGKIWPFEPLWWSNIGIPPSVKHFILKNFYQGSSKLYFLWFIFIVTRNS